MAVVPFARAAAAVVPEDAPGLVLAFEKLLADPPRVARSDDPRMALGKLHFYVLAKRLTPTAAIDVLSGAGGRPLARELAARAAIESVFGPLVDSPKSGCYWWCRGPGKVVVEWHLTELGEAEYREETAVYVARKVPVPATPREFQATQMAHKKEAHKRRGAHVLLTLGAAPATAAAMDAAPPMLTMPPAAAPVLPNGPPPPAGHLRPRPVLYVKQSTIDGAGGGLFSGRTLAADEYLLAYKGVHVKAATMRAPGYMRGYIMRVGPRYIDGRDLESGRLRLANGSVVDVSAFTHADWGRLDAVGLEWVGEATLARFVNEAEQDHNVIFRSGKLYTLQEIPADTELVVCTYGGGFWKSDDGAHDDGARSDGATPHDPIPALPVAESPPASLAAIGPLADSTEDSTINSIEDSTVDAMEEALPQDQALVGCAIRLVKADATGRVVAYNPLDRQHTIVVDGRERRERLSRVAWELVERGTLDPPEPTARERCTTQRYGQEQTGIRVGVDYQATCLPEPSGGGGGSRGGSQSGGRSETLLYRGSMDANAVADPSETAQLGRTSRKRGHDAVDSFATAAARTEATVPHTLERSITALAKAFPSAKAKGCLLLHGSCHEIVPRLPSRTVDAFVVDPPYGVNRAGWDTKWSEEEWAALAAEVWRVLRPGGHWLIFCQGKLTFELETLLADKALLGHYRMYWNTGRTNTNIFNTWQPRHQIEDILVLYRKGEKDWSQYRKLRPGQSDLLDFPIEHAYLGVKADSLKPPALMDELVRRYTSDGGTVCDFCMNSGVCGSAAMEAGRRFVGVEADRKIYQKACANLGAK